MSLEKIPRKNLLFLALSAPASRPGPFPVLGSGVSAHSFLLNLLRLLTGSLTDLAPQLEAGEFLTLPSEPTAVPQLSREGGKLVDAAQLKAQETRPLREMGDLRGVRG